MSNRWPGGIIRKTPVTPAGPFQNGAAPGMWTLAEASFWTKQGLWPIAGNFLAVEDVFSTWLYTGNSSTQTITNGIDLAGKGGMVWLKRRNADGVSYLADTARGPGFIVQSSTTTQQQFSASGYVSGFNSNGFQIIAGPNFSAYNETGQTYVSWTFREAPNFFDVVTFTSNSSGGASFDHNLGSTPGMVIIKCTSATESWWVWHRSLATNQYLVLNLTQAVQTTTPTITCTSTTVTLTSGWLVNNNANYVAYLYAHDPSADGIIQCGSYTGNGSATGPVVTLGWEPQWVLIKNAGADSDWYLFDNMRGMPVGANDLFLRPNLSSAEAGTGNFIDPTATGFNIMSASSAFNTNGTTYIYMAIRRGPMRTPTLGTSVFQPFVNYTSIANQINGTIGPIDMTMQTQVPTPLVDYHFTTFDRLRGSVYLRTSATAAEIAGAVTFDTNIGVRNGFWFSSGGVGYNFSRAPGFFDEVCYTGTGSATTFNHNLGAVPELMIVKRRNSTGNWRTYNAIDGNTKYMNLQDTDGSLTDSTNWNNTSPTSSVFTVGTNSNVNASGGTYVAYLFASVPGVSKVGSYTGNGSSQTINCAFTTGARFVLIKRTDSTGGWLVWDSARGIVAGNDPYLALNSTAAEVTSNDSVDTDSTGFVVNQVAASNINVNAATYIFLAIA